MTEPKDSKRFTLARKEKQNADIIRKQNLARIFLSSALNEEIEQDDMSVALQDGVLLCKLINHYKPDSIKRYNANPRIPFKMMENALYVLDFCKKNAIPINFTAEDICNKEHSILILEFILNIAEKLGWSPPPIPEMSASLSSLSSSSSSSSGSTPSPRATPSPPPHSSSPSPSPSSRPPPKQNNGVSSGGAPSLKSVMNELVTSEKDFLQDMELFFKIYVGPARAILPSDKTNAIFGNLENVVGANNKFMNELLGVVDGYASIETVWKNFASAINIYSVYCIFQQNSYGVLEQCRREFPAFDAHLRAVEYTPESKKTNIFNFLVKPFARVVKYNAVLKQLLQCVSPGTEEYDSLAECKKEFQDLSDTTSETWKKVENSRKIAEIAGNLMGAEKAGLRKLGRIYLREADFVVNGKTTKLFLFSDIIVYAAPVKGLLKKSGGKSHIFKGIVPLTGANFQDIPDGKEGKNLMELTSGDKNFKIAASSPSDKRLWVTDIKKCIAKLSGHHGREAPTNPSPLEPRPMLGMGRGTLAGRQNSQTQVIIEERRKTVKLAFGDRADDDDEDDEERDEVDLEMRVEEDKRKTVKLEFAPRQLTVRDRSKTVDLGFKDDNGQTEGVEPGEDEQVVRDRSTTVDLGFKDIGQTEGAAGEEEQEQEPQLIVDRRKTVKLAFNIPRPSSVSSADDQDEQEEKAEEFGDRAEEHEQQIGGGEHSDYNEQTDQNQDILRTDIREHKSDDSSDSSDSDEEEKKKQHEHKPEKESESSSDSDNKEDAVPILLPSPADSSQLLHPPRSPHPPHTPPPAHTPPPVVRFADDDQQFSHSRTPPPPLNEEQLEPATEHAPAKQDLEYKPHNGVDSNSHIEPPVAQPEPTASVPTVSSRLEPIAPTQKIGHLEPNSEESDNIISTLIEELQGLKAGLKAAQEKLQQTVEELEKEREDNKQWKTRVERILSVLLDAMKQKG